MIDIENKVIDTLITAVGSSALVVGEYIATPSSFPCVMVLQTINSTFKKTLDNSLAPHHARISFQIDVYSNKSSGAKSEVKELFQIVDTAMQGMKFTLENFIMTPNYDRSITRGTARYSAIVGEGKTVGTTTTYQMYR